VADALDAAARALARRDRSEAGVLEVLRRKGVSEGEAVEAVETLRRLGAVDDERFAEAGAASLVERGYGDAAIAFRLEREGVTRELAERAVSALEPENERAGRLVARRGATAKTARWLASRGFASDSVEAAIAKGEGAELG
jgi:SOS response regulatory protein OraA/RecX